MIRISALAAAAGIALAFAAGAAEAQIVHYEALLKGPGGHGELDATLDTDTRVLDYTVTYAGLKSPVVGGAFTDAHGAAPTAKLSGSSPLESTVKLTDKQVDALNAEHWSFALATAAYPKGELTGKVERSTNF